MVYNNIKNSNFLNLELKQLSGLDFRSFSGSIQSFTSIDLQLSATRWSIEIMVKHCWKPSMEGDRLLWHKDIGSHVSGEFSMAVIQANNLLDSQLVSGQLSSLNSGPSGTFIGVYDGHGGPETSKFLNDSLFPNLKRLISEHQGISASVIKKAFMATEEDFISSIRDQWHTKPQIAAVGTCCLVGIISDGFLYVGNAGDSRVVLGRADRAFKHCICKR